MQGSRMSFSGRMRGTFTNVLATESSRDAERGLPAKNTGFLTDLLASLFERAPAAGAPSDFRPIENLCIALMSGKGEISGVRLAREIIARYREMNAEERRAFFRFIANSFDIDPEAVATAAQAYAESRDRASLAAINAAAEPKRREFLRRLNQAPGVTGDLVRMRLDLLNMLHEDPDFGRADLDFARLFASWFNRGFLVLRAINWLTPANILEKIIAYEAVHEISDWDDLRRRLQPPDRRCFAFFHPSMPDEPLIFVEVALTKGVPGSVQEVLAEGRTPLSPEEADTAVFYSISNCQDGLRGISFGNSLIKQVVEELGKELPHLQCFVTLSPVPGFASWLKQCVENDGDPEAETLLAAAKAGPEAMVGQSDLVRTRVAKYLVEAKRPDGSPVDAVARFHLGNGALLHDVHAMADISPKGLRQSCGAMVNYLYELGAVEDNHEAFATRQAVITSRNVSGVLKANQPKAKKDRKVSS